MIKRLSKFAYSIPSIGVALLPKLCPVCLTAFAGILSSLGIGATIYNRFLLPLTLAFLIVALFSLLFRARNRHGFLPFIFGLNAAIMIVLGKFVLSSNLINYGGIVLLIMASLWNSWPNRNLMLNVALKGNSGRGGVNHG